MRYRSTVFHVLYRSILKPIFFAQDPEAIHDRMVAIGSRLGRNTFTRKLTQICFNYTNPSLGQSKWGIYFCNPVGLAAGFDKEGKLCTITGDVGFGFTEVGTVTYSAYEGNPKPRLYRLPHSQGLVVYYGLKNSGAENIVAHLRTEKKTVPRVISIGKTNCSRTADEESGIDDYRKCVQVFRDHNEGDIYELNISCPNTFGGEPFTTRDRLQKLLEALNVEKIDKPIILKMPINLPWEEFRALLDVALYFGVQAVNIGNLNKDRSDASIKEQIPENIRGSISGKPTWELSNELISKTYAYCGNKMVIIGTGGIFSAEDAYEKIKRGASLVQLITGMIYEGPQLIGTINYELARFLKRDGYKTIAEAVGAYHRT